MNSANDFSKKIDNIIKANKYFEFIESFDTLDDALYCGKSFFVNCVCKKMKNNCYIISSETNKTFSIWVENEFNETNYGSWIVIKCFNKTSS